MQPEANHVVSALGEALQGRQDVDLAILFGSQAKGSARPDSDVDVAVLARAGTELELARDLSLALGKEVDVVSLVDPTIPLLEELIAHGKVVREGSPGAGARWRFHALLQLETDRPWYARMRDAWLARVAERGV